MSGYVYEMSAAFAGMLADTNRQKHVKTLPSGSATQLRFGIVVHELAGKAVLPSVASSVPAGITVHDHIDAVKGGYDQYDAVNVLDSGTIWARVTNAGTVTKGGPVSYASDGTVSDGGANLFPNALFESGAISMGGGFDETPVVLAQIRLGHPLATTTVVVEEP